MHPNTSPRQTLPASNTSKDRRAGRFDVDLARRIDFERKAEGIAAAKQRGAYRGRPPRIDMESIRHRLAMGLSPTQVARELGVSRGTVYKAKAGIA